MSKAGRRKPPGAAGRVRPALPCRPGIGPFARAKCYLACRNSGVKLFFCAALRCRIVLKLSLAAGGTPRQRRMERRPPADLLPFVARNHARQAKPDRALAPLSMLATLAPPTANAAWRGARSGRKGSRSGAFVRQSRTKAQAGRPWVHAAFRPCGTRAVFAATNIAAHAGAKACAAHSAVNTILRQSRRRFVIDRRKPTA